MILGGEICWKDGWQGRGVTSKKTSCGERISQDSVWLVYGGGGKDAGNG